MQEALEMVCRKRKLANPKDYALLLRLPDATIMIPLDRTVASLQGNRELLLVKRTMLNTLGLNISKEIKTTDPNGMNTLMSREKRHKTDAGCLQRLFLKGWKLQSSTSPPLRWITRKRTK
jgi:hypothetical protein